MVTENTSGPAGRVRAGGAGANLGAGNARDAIKAGARKSENFASWVIWLVVVPVVLVMYLLPASIWYEIKSVTVLDGTAGNIHMSVDRTIHRAFQGEYYTSVRSMPDRSVVCAGGSDIAYDPRSSLPDPLTLAWWTGGACDTTPALKPGPYVLVTTFEVDAVPFFTKYVEVTSPVFNVLDNKEEMQIEFEQNIQRQVIENLIGETRSLKREIESLKGTK